ncbi:MAG: chalcone isomerase family protein [Halieaceae bacterium]|jgi:hypothetical protein|nr:chalcone isomerase family protein [Halieaceae bacterium]
MDIKLQRGLAALAIAGLGLLPECLLARGLPTGELEGMSVVGEARMRVLFWDVYDARLLAPEGHYCEDQPFALSLTYLRKLDGDKIAARSVEEMRKQGVDDEAALQRWYTRLLAIIPDVGDQDEIVGVASADGSTRFFLDGNAIGRVDEPAFTQAFFSIWLGEATSEPKFRDNLLGARK